MTQYKKTLIGLERTFNGPLEKNTLFATVAEMTTYMQNDLTKYNGQIVTVAGNGTSTKGVNYRLDQIGSQWKAVLLADSEDVATKAQGTKADTAVQSATIGGVTVPKSSTAFQFPAYPTSLPASDKSTILNEAATTAQSKVDAHAGDTTKHITATERTLWNSHQTAAQVRTIADTAITAKKGVANGIASLDGTGKVPATQLPSYVDDVVEVIDFVTANPTTGMTSGQIYYNKISKKLLTATSATTVSESTPEDGKIYISHFNNKTFRWSGSDMVVISETIALGETDSTAYVGSKGKTLFDWMANVSGNNVTVNNKTKLNNVPSTVVIGGELQSISGSLSILIGSIDTNTGAPSATPIEIPTVSTSGPGVLSVSDYSEFKGKIGSTGNTSNTTVAFTTAAARNNVATGEKLSVLFGKVAKWFSDLKALAFKDKVGTADITDESVTYNKLNTDLQRSADLVTQHLFKSTPLLVETSDSKSATKSQLLNSAVRVDSTTKISGVKKYVYLEIEKGHSDGDLLCIRDEAGHIVTDLFTRTALIADISYEYTSLCEIGTLYISFLN